MKRPKFELGRVRAKALWFGVFVVLLALYVVRLGGLPTGALSAQEVQNLQSSASLHGLIDSPLLLPLTFLRWAAQQALPHHMAYAARLPSAALALVAIGALLYLARRWYGPRTLLFALLSLGASAWFLHVGRLGTNDIAYLALLPILLAAHLILYEYPENKLIFFLWAATVSLLLYVPGGIWFIALSIWWQRKDIAAAWKSLKLTQRSLLTTLALLLVVPLIYGLVHQLSLSYTLGWLGLPAHLPTWSEPLKNLAAAAGFIFIRAPYDPTRWLGRLPLLDAFMTVSFLAGCLFYAGHLKAERTRLLLSYGVLALLLCAAGGQVVRSVLVPLVYLVALGGIAFLLHQWLKLFPNNILARRTGIALIYLALVLSCTFNLRHYFVAWQHSPDTRAVFVYRPPQN